VRFSYGCIFNKNSTHALCIIIEILLTCVHLLLTHNKYRHTMTIVPFRQITKSLILAACAAALLLGAGQAIAQTNGSATEGYNIQLDLKPYSNQWIFLASYYGSIKTLADSAFLNKDSKGVLKGSAPLPQGVYIIASPSKTILVEVLVGKDQSFSVSADTTNIESTLKITGSPDNDQFYAYTSFIAPRARKAEMIRPQLDSAKGAQKETLEKEMAQLNKEIIDYRKDVMTQAPESLLAALFFVMQDVELPSELMNPKTRKDTLAQYRYAKDHYWDGVDFMDGRLVRTPVFDNKLTRYLENWVSPEPDSIIYEYNWMIALGRNDEEMEKYLVGYFIDHYMYPKIMGQDKVFLHVYEKYIAGDKPKASWLNEKQIKIITERAYMVMANQLGAKGWDMELVDTAGKTRTLYSVNADYTIVSFWDVHCGKCKEDMPKLDTLYRTKWKGKGVKVYAVMVNESAKADWPPYIRKLSPDWIHVHQPEAVRTAEEKAGKPNFRQLYDMRHLLAGQGKANYC
jgi:hypothetical protein